MYSSLFGYCPDTAAAAAAFDMMVMEDIEKKKKKSSAARSHVPYYGVREDEYDEPAWDDDEYDRDGGDYKW